MSKTKILTANGTVLSESELEYRKCLIQDSHSIYCPITHKPLSILKGEILLVNANDYFISDEGLERLKTIFGEKAITGRIITYD